MKKLAVLAVTVLFSLSLFASDPVAVNEKVLQAFQQSFKNASAIEWQESGDRFEVKFVYNEINSRITYNKDASVVSVLRYYGEEQLPLLLRAKLQKEFAGKHVFGITEFSKEGTLDYYIVLEDATTWSHVKCNSNGEMEVYKEFTKS
jgi:hypothetical protein